MKKLFSKKGIIIFQGGTLKLVKREVFYFEKSGEHNTDHVIKSVKERTGLGDLSYIAVASNSGKTALKLSKMLRNTDVPIICVTESSQRRDWEAQ